MADTIADIILTGTEYQDVYSETGITVGTKIVIQNKTTDKVWVQVNASQPSSDSRDGYLMEPDAKFPISIDVGASGCWAFGNGPISVNDGGLIVA